MARDQEPSVEEILASIKKIIAEDEQQAPRVANRRSPTPEPEVEPDILELTDGEPFEFDEDSGPDSDDSTDEPLLAPGTADSLRHSLSALAALGEPGSAPQIVRSGETSLEGLVREMLRPMLKEWLDANLPTIVEKAIAREIQRVMRRD